MKLLSFDLTGQLSLKRLSIFFRLLCKNSKNTMSHDSHESRKRQKCVSFSYTLPLFNLLQNIGFSEVYTASGDSQFFLADTSKLYAN